MNAILNVARLHLTLILQDRSTYIQAFAVPVLMMMILSLALNEDQVTDLNLIIDVVDRDQSELAAQFVQTLQAEERLTICLYGMADLPDDCGLKVDDTFENEGEERLAQQNATAALVIPSGFEAALLAGEALELEYRSDEQLNTPTLARTAIESALVRFNGSLQIASVGVQTLRDDLGGFENENQALDDFSELQNQAEIGLAQPPIGVEAISTGTEEVIVGLGARQSVPGMGSMFVLFSLLSIAQYLVEERSQGTLPRLLTMPTRRVNIVLGKMLGTFAFGYLQFGVFILVGTALGINWGADPLAVAVLVGAYCLAGTAIGFMLATFVRTVAQAGNMITLFGLLLAPLGGAWWPLAITPTFMQRLGHLSPIAWLMDGFQELLYYNGTLTDILPMLGVLMLFTVLFTTIATFNFRFE